jgi:hypothetical protein
MCQLTESVTLPGTRFENYDATATVGTQTLVWAKCGAVGPLFNANSQVIVGCTNKTESALATVDVQDTKFTIV